MKVYNLYHKDAPSGSVYIGRPSRWGNPYVIGKDGNRKEVVEKYTVYLADKLLNDKEFVADLKELCKAPGLVGYCKPAECHGDHLVSAMIMMGFVNKEDA